MYEVFEGNMEVVIDMVPAGKWHNLRSMAEGTILFEAKHGKWEPMKPEDILKK